MKADELLREWAAWCRSGDPLRFGPNTNWPDGPPLPEFPAYEFWRPLGDSRETGWGDADAAPEVPPVPVNEKRAADTDRLIMHLPVRHVLVIKRTYYNGRKEPWEDVYAARRALQDLLDMMEGVAVWAA